MDVSAVSSWPAQYQTGVAAEADPCLRRFHCRTDNEAAQGQEGLRGQGPFLQGNVVIGRQRHAHFDTGSAATAGIDTQASVHAFDAFAHA